MTQPFQILAQSGISSFLGGPIPLMIAFFGIFYILIIRPQQKRQKAIKNQIDALKINDKVVTIGGMHGTVLGIGETTFTLKTEDGTRIEFDKSAIARVDK